MKGSMKNNKFTAKIDSDSPVTIITTKDLKDNLRTDVLFARALPRSEKYMDFNQQPLKILQFIHVQLKVGTKEIKKARISVVVTGKSLVGRNWLSALQYQFKPSSQIAASECILLISSHSIDGGHSSKVENINRNDVKSAFPQFFTRQGKVIGHTIKIEIELDLKIIQQKTRWIPLHLQESFQKEKKGFCMKNISRKYAR